MCHEVIFVFETKRLPCLYRRGFKVSNISTKVDAWVGYFLSNLYFFHEMITHQKLQKMLFISSRKLFSFSRYSNVCNFFPSCPHIPDSKEQMEME